jgi:hypothetical protein
MTPATVVANYIREVRLSRLKGLLGLFSLVYEYSLFSIFYFMLWRSIPSVPRGPSLVHLYGLPERSVHVDAVDSDATLPNVNGLDIESGEFESLSVPRVLSSRAPDRHPTRLQYALHLQDLVV